MFGILPRKLEIRHATDRAPAPAETETALPDRRIVNVSAQALRHRGNELFWGVILIAEAAHRYYLVAWHA